VGGAVTSLRKCGTLAQLVEQRTFNPFVVGSTPARPTKLLYESFVSFASKLVYLDLSGCGDEEEVANKLTAL
jgi:hypothetical protein